MTNNCCCCCRYVFRENNAGENKMESVVNLFANINLECT